MSTSFLNAHRDTREKLEHHAQHWWRIAALDDQTPRTTLCPLPSSSFSNPALSLCSNPSVRLPSYTVHTSAPVPEDHLIIPYTGLKGVEMCAQDPRNCTANSVSLATPPSDVFVEIAAPNEAPVLSTLNGHDPNGGSAIVHPWYTLLISQKIHKLLSAHGRH
jgi:hypothetical protein